MVKLKPDCKNSGKAKYDVLVICTLKLESKIMPTKSVIEVSTSFVELEASPKSKNVLG